MRSINESAKGFNKDQREIHSNRKVKMHFKTKLPVTQHRRKQNIQGRTKDAFSPGVGEEEEEEEGEDYNIDDELILYNDIEEIATESPEVSIPFSKKTKLNNITLCCSRSSVLSNRWLLLFDLYSNYFRMIPILLKSQPLKVSRHQLQYHHLVLIKNRLSIRT